MNKTDSARTVPRSVTKVAEIRSWPSAVRARPVSTATAHMTATDVVDNAMPPMSAASHDHPRANRHSRTSKNGAAKESVPIDRLARQVRRNCAGSISVPALKVKTTLPKLARI